MSAKYVDLPPSSVCPLPLPLSTPLPYLVLVTKKLSIWTGGPPRGIFLGVRKIFRAPCKKVFSKKVLDLFKLRSVWQRRLYYNTSRIKDILLENETHWIKTLSVSGLGKMSPYIPLSEGLHMDVIITIGWQWNFNFGCFSMKFPSESRQVFPISRDQSVIVAEFIFRDRMR